MIPDSRLGPVAVSTTLLFTTPAALHLRWQPLAFLAFHRHIRPKAISRPVTALISSGRPTRSPIRRPPITVPPLSLHY